MSTDEFWRVTWKSFDEEEMCRELTEAYPFPVPCGPGGQRVRREGRPGLTIIQCETAPLRR